MFSWFKVTHPLIPLPLYLIQITIRTFWRRGHVCWWILSWLKWMPDETMLKISIHSVLIIHVLWDVSLVTVHAISEVRGVLVSVNYGCFSPSRFSHFHCYVVRKAIKAPENLYTNQQSKHTPAGHLQNNSSKHSPPLGSFTETLVFHRGLESVF